MNQDVEKILKEIKTGTNATYARLALNEGIQVVLDKNPNNFMLTLLRGDLSEAFLFGDGDAKAAMHRAFPSRFKLESVPDEVLTEVQKEAAMRLFCTSNISYPDAVSKIIEQQ